MRQLSTRTWQFRTTPGLYHFGARNYSASLSVWSIPEPTQYINGANTYQKEIDGPVEVGLFFSGVLLIVDGAVGLGYEEIGGH